MIKHYLIEYLVHSLADVFQLKVSYTELFEYSKDRGYEVSNESIDLIVQEFALSVITNIPEIDLELKKVELCDELSFSGLIAKKINFGSKIFECFAKEAVLEFLAGHLQLRGLNLVKIAPLEINYTAKVFRRQYTFISSQYLYTPAVRQMYIAVMTILNGEHITFYLNRVLVHKLYKEYYLTSDFTTHYELSPLLQLSELMELWLRDGYGFEVNIQQVKLVYIKKGCYLKIDCFVDDSFCGYILSDSYQKLASINNINQASTVIENNLAEDLILQFPLNIGICELNVADLENLVLGDVVMLDGYAAQDNRLLYLDLGKVGFTAVLDNDKLKLLDLK